MSTESIGRRSLIKGGAAIAAAAALSVEPTRASDNMWLAARSPTEVLIEQCAGTEWRTCGTSTGASGSGPDETRWLQAAVDRAARLGLRVSVTQGVHRTTSTILSGEPGTIRGISPPMPASLAGTNLTATPANIRRGSWLFFDHTFRGIQYGTDHYIQSVEIEDLGFGRPQPAPGQTSWLAKVSDYDIVGSNCDMLVRSVLHLNTSHGILHNFGGYGRFEADRVRGQFFKVGIQLNGQFDLPRIRDCHFWPFWSQDQIVSNYQRDNLQAVQFYGVDGVHMSDFFCISHKIALAYYESSGHSERVHQISNLYTDVGGTGIYVDKSVVHGITLDVSNWMANAYEPNPTGSPPSPGLDAWALDVQGNNSEISISNMRSELMPDGMVRLLGTGNNVQVGAAEVERWNRNGNGAAAFDCKTGNVLTINSNIKIDGDALATTVNLFSGAGTILWPLSRQAGVALLAAGATSVSVNHGQARAPTAAQCSCWFAGNPYRSSKCWITDITATTMVLNVDAAPGTPITLGWEANAFS